MCVCVSVMCVRVCVFMHVYYVSVYTWAYECVYVRTRVFMWVCVCMCLCNCVIERERSERSKEGGGGLNVALLIDSLTVQNMFSQSKYKYYLCISYKVRVEDLDIFSIYIYALKFIIYVKTGIRYGSESYTGPAIKSHIIT